ncbi:MBL fold metallo-hydrolase [Acidobacteriota bacterium]
MRRVIRFIGVMILVLGLTAVAQVEFEEDVFQTAAGELKITLVGHGTLYLAFDGKVIHIDPVGRYADYSQLPKADIILITHDHGDHLDSKAIKLLLKQKTDILLTEKCAEKVDGGLVMNNGQSLTSMGIKIEAVPAYNIKNERSPGNPFHPKGEGNGYVLTFGDKKVYIAGDSENTPEMKALKDIDRLPSHEPPLHYESRYGGRCSEGLSTENPLSLPFRADGYFQTRRTPEGFTGHRGENPEYEINMCLLLTG